jgi:glycosyltransferase involved in cell wall biosynthesis
VFNPDVGSAIEYMGDTLVSWLKEIGDVHNCKYQTRTSHYVKFLKDYQPDLIVTNEMYVRIITAANIYKHITGVPYIHVDHVWKRLNCKRTDMAGLLDYEALMECREVADWIFCTNYMPSYEKWHHRVAHKISNRYYATNPDVFNIRKPWSDRTKMFGYFGNLLPHKLSNEFLRKIQDTNIVVDCYGRRMEEHTDLVITESRNKEYYTIFDSAVESGNINYYGLIDQDKIADVMNEYKYFVMPHCGDEPFNWVLKQCAYCGTVPLVVNDRNSQQYDGKWIDWATGLYLGCESVNHSVASETVSKIAMDKFSYQEFKEEFQNKARELLNG